MAASQQRWHASGAAAGGSGDSFKPLHQLYAWAMGLRAARHHTSVRVALHLLRGRPDGFRWRLGGCGAGRV
eukprot:7488033-Prorocentrum_lima.AAC.1